MKKLRVVVLCIVIIVGIAVLPLAINAPAFFFYPYWVRAKTTMLTTCFKEAVYCSKQDEFQDSCSFSKSISIVAASEQLKTPEQLKTHWKNLTVQDRYDTYKQMCVRYLRPSIDIYLHELLLNVYVYWKSR